MGYYSIYIALLMIAPPLVSTPIQYLGVGSEDAIFVTWLVINAIAILFLLSLAREQPGTAVLAISISVYLLVASQWAEAPATSLAYGSTLAGVVIVAYLMSVDLTMRELLALVARVIVTLAVVGLALYAARVGFAIYIDAANRPNLLGGAPFKGLFPHKIVAGFYAAIGVVAILATFRRGFGRIASIALLILVIVLSSSSTAIVLLPFAVAVYAVTRRALERGMSPRSWIATLCAMAAFGGALVWWSWTDVLDLLGRDATLTGRTILWDWGISTWFERPIFGWGYGSYFETPQAQAFAYSIPEFRTWDVPHFHQTYIQTAVDFGLVGLVALVVVLVKVLVRSYSQSSIMGSAASAGIFAITLTIAGAGFVMYLIPSYAYTEVVPLFIFVAFFATRVQRPRNRQTPRERALQPMSSKLADTHS